MEKSKSRLFHLAWKSRKKRGIPTFHTASTAAGYFLLDGLIGSDPNRQKWLPLSPALTGAVPTSMGCKYGARGILTLPARSSCGPVQQASILSRLSLRIGRLQVGTFVV